MVRKSIAMLLLALPFISTAKTTHYGSVKLTHLDPVSSESIWLRKNQVSPRYPIEMARNGVTGCGIFKFNINEEGKAKNIELVSSVPKKVIYKPAKKIIKKWKWSNVSNETNRSEEKLIRLDFCMGGNSVPEADALCAKQAELQCK